jgi:type III restriction enzyme
VGEDGDRASMRRAKLEAFGLAQDPGVLAEIDSLAQSTVQAWLDEHWALIKVLPESRRQRYADIRGQAASPERTGLEFPEFVESRKSGKPLEGHLYVNEEGSYQTTLNTWETQLLEEELEIEDLEVWFRNIPRKPWSFTVPYEMDGAVHPLYPDFLFLRRTGNGLIVDVVDPHDPGQPDAPYKAVGLAQFARDHGQDFGRIELVALDRKVLKRLDLQDEKIRDRVLKVRDRSHLDDLYRTA